MCVVCGCMVDSRPYVEPDDVGGDPPVVGTQGAVAAPAGADGRIALADVGREQPVWGWGLAPAVAAEGADAALTALPMDPAGFSVRQQDAIRRDVAGTLGDYLGYAPVPFAGVRYVHGPYGRQGESDGNK